MRFATKVLFLVGAVQGVRLKRSSEGQEQAHIAGVPIHNYRADAEDFVVLFGQGTTNAKIDELCAGQCIFMGHPDEGGAAFAKVRGAAKLDQLLRRRDHSVELLEVDGESSIIPELDMPAPRIASEPWGLEAIGVEERTSHGKGVHIYVQDTGVRASHNDFGGRVVPTLDISSGSIVECKGDASCARDGNGHGTHCAGTAGGKAYGVADQATIHAVKSMSDGGRGEDSWQYASIDHIVATAKRPAVLSMSLGGYSQKPGYAASIKAATTSGITVVVAAGNNDMDACEFSPAFVPEAITVGATTWYGGRAAFSNYGKCNDIMAPGTTVLSAAHDSDSGSIKLSGTSMACPHVSGAAALILEKSPSKKSHEVMAALEDNALRNVISALKPEDPEIFLWVGAKVNTPAPTPAPVKTCPSEFSTGPDRTDDCTCNSGLKCYEDGQLKCTFSSTSKYGFKSDRFFNYACANCVCK